MCLNNNDDNSSPIASITLFIIKVRYIEISEQSTDLSNELKVVIGCDPSTMFCKSEKPDVPACNPTYPFNLGCQTIS